MGCINTTFKRNGTRQSDRWITARAASVSVLRPECRGAQLFSYQPEQVSSIAQPASYGPEHQGHPQIFFGIKPSGQIFGTTMHIRIRDVSGRVLSLAHYGKRERKSGWRKTHYRRDSFAGCRYRLKAGSTLFSMTVTTLPSLNLHEYTSRAM